MAAGMIKFNAFLLNIEPLLAKTDLKLDTIHKVLKSCEHAELELECNCSVPGVYMQCRFNIM